MKKILNNILFGNSSLKGGAFALVIVGLIVLGCTCNTTDGFKFGNKDKNDTKTNDKADEKKSAEKSDASRGELPSEEELQEITRTSILDFNNALQTEDFKEFYDSTSKPFQRSTSPRRLKRKFKTFIDGNADLSGVRSLKANFSPSPRIDKSKRVAILEIEGDYDTKPRVSTFKLKYVAEGKEWKLISIYVVTNITKRR